MSRVREALRSAEASRQLAGAAADWDDLDRPFRVVTVTNNKGGVGKSTIALNLAVYLRALHEDLPILVVALDEQPLPDLLLGNGPADAAETVLGGLRRGTLAPAIRLGQYGVHHVPTSPDVAELKREIDDPAHLQRVLLATGFRGLVIVDTKSDFEILTQNAIAASDLSVVVVKDHASLIEAQKVFDMLEGWRRPREVARIVLSLVDLRIKYDAGRDRDVLALLISSIRRLGLPLFETFVSRSAKVEALYTNPEGRPRAILHGAPHSLVNRQMRLLAHDVLRAVDPDGRLHEAIGAPPQTADAPGRPRVALGAAPQAEDATAKLAGTAPRVRLHGLTPEARAALPSPTLHIERLPFRIGRLDVGSRNDLSIRDRPPWQVSRRHAQLVEVDGRIGVIDLGSRVGTGVDARRIGGAEKSAGPAFFRPEGGTLVLGSPRSPFAFQVRIDPAPPASTGEPR